MFPFKIVWCSGMNGAMLSLLSAIKSFSLWRSFQIRHDLICFLSSWTFKCCRHLPIILVTWRSFKLVQSLIRKVTEYEQIANSWPQTMLVYGEMFVAPKCEPDWWMPVPVKMRDAAYLPRTVTLAIQGPNPTEVIYGIHNCAAITTALSIPSHSAALVPPILTFAPYLTGSFIDYRRERIENNHTKIPKLRKLMSGCDNLACFFCLRK